MKFKKCRLWTKEEDKILKHGYDKYIFNSHDSMSGKIQTDLLNKCNSMRTNRAINRRATRLGLKSYEYNDKVLITKCIDCGMQIDVFERYLKMYKKLRCPKCKAKFKADWRIRNNERYKDYHKMYYTTHKGSDNVGRNK